MADLANLDENIRSIKSQITDLNNTVADLVAKITMKQFSIVVQQELVEIKDAITTLETEVANIKSNIGL